MPEQSIIVHTAQASVAVENTCKTVSLTRLGPSSNRPSYVQSGPKILSKTPPSSLRKELMVPILAYRIQEKEFGGLSHPVRRQLLEVAFLLNIKKPLQEHPVSSPLDRRGSADARIKFVSKLKAHPGILALSPFSSPCRMCKLQILHG